LSLLTSDKPKLVKNILTKYQNYEFKYYYIRSIILYYVTSGNHLYRKKVILGLSIFFLYKKNLRIINMFLLVNNHDNENLTKNRSETKNVDPAQNHIHVK